MNEYFAKIQEECKEERVRVEKMNYLYDYSSYKICNDKISQFEDQMNYCYKEICEIKHIVQCTKDINKTHIEELNFIKKVAEEKQEEIPRQNATIKQNLNIRNVFELGCLQNYAFKVL